MHREIYDSSNNLDFLTSRSYTCSPKIRYFISELAELFDIMLIIQDKSCLGSHLICQLIIQLKLSANP